ncbi:MAG: hypothetical protein AAF745_15780, partial [Planctomycetota bacterium]
MRHRLSTRFDARHQRCWILRALCLAGLLLLTPGCFSTRYLQNRSFRDNALASTLKLARWRGPEISPRTQNALRRYGLVETFENDSQICLHHLRTRHHQNPDRELAYALAEIAYVEGKRSERAGRASDAMNHYGIALTTSYRYLFGDQLADVRNAYDPQFRSVCDLYNESLEDLLRILCSENRLRPGQTYTIRTADRQFTIRTEMRGGWQPDEFDRFEFVSDYDIKTLRNRHTTYGLGVPLIAVRRPRGQDDTREDYYPEGLSYAVTAMLRCSTQPSETLGGELPAMVADPSQPPECVLEFFDPLRANQIHLAKQWVPLETDLTTPLAYFLDSPEYRKRDRATEGLLDPDDAQRKRGLYMLEPYDPERIPVLMVHG